MGRLRFAPVYLVVLGFVAFCIFMSPAVSAASPVTFTVTRLDDPTPDGCQPTDCSLREAIIAANTDAITDTIEFALDGTVELSIAPTGDNDASSGDLNITQPLYLNGRGTSDTIIDANQLDRVFFVNVNCPGQEEEGVIHVFFQDMTVTGGETTSNGGGIRINGCTRLQRMLIQDNHADHYGGGVYADFASFFETFVVVNSAVVNNSAAYGGGLAVYDGYLDLRQSTVSHNDALNIGGGIAAISSNTLFYGSMVWLTDNTIAYNSSNAGADGAGFGLHRENPNTTLGDLFIYPGNNIVAYNTGGVQCGDLDEGSTTGVNLSPDASCEGGIVADPLLGPLADNGGDTLTHALGVLSPAIDAGNCTSTTDQRGEPRPVDLPDYPNAANGCDIGAYESQSIPTAITLGNFGATSTPYTVTPLIIGLAGLGYWAWRRRAGGS